jgi:hypothetical protein
MLPSVGDVEQPDWKVTLPNALAAAKAGATVQVPVHVLRDRSRTMGTRGRR